MPPETAVTFFAASVLLALAPGPDNLFVLTEAALRGRSAGLIIVLGLCTGLIGHSSAVALGAAAVFQTSALAFMTLKYLGAGYLLYLAWHAFRAPAGHLPAGARREEISPWSLYRRGIIMNVTNPKVSLFFLAFLPQFADPSRGSISLQIFLLGALFILATVLVFGGIALLAGTIGPWLARSGRAQGIMNRVAGVVFLGLALKLATTNR